MEHTTEQFDAILARLKTDYLPTWNAGRGADEEMILEAICKIAEELGIVFDTQHDKQEGDFLLIDRLTTSVLNAIYGETPEQAAKRDREEEAWSLAADMLDAQHGEGE